MTITALYGTAKYGESYYGVVLTTITSDIHIATLGYLGPSQPDITAVKYVYTKPVIRKDGAPYVKPTLRSDTKSLTKPTVRTNYKKMPYLVDSY